MNQDEIIIEVVDEEIVFEVENLYTGPADSGGGTPGGSDKSVQFNDGGSAFGGFGSYDKISGKVGFEIVEDAINDSKQIRKNTRKSSGTPDNSFGLYSSDEIHNAINVLKEAFKEETRWIDPTNGSEISTHDFYILQNGSLVKCFGIEGGSGSMTYGLMMIYGLGGNGQIFMKHESTYDVLVIDGREGAELYGSNFVRLFAGNGYWQFVDNNGYPFEMYSNDANGNYIRVLGNAQFGRLRFNKSTNKWESSNDDGLTYNTAPGNWAVALGPSTRANADYSVVIGSGSDGYPVGYSELRNNILKSLLIGFNEVRTFHVINDDISGNYIKIYGQIIYGQCTSAGTSTTLHDNTALFLAQGLVAGDIVVNCLDSSEAVIVTVDNNDQLTTTALTGGVSNKWDDGSYYCIYKGGGYIRYYTTTKKLQFSNDGSIWTDIGAGGGTGDVVGPAGATADDIVTFDLATGKLIKDSGKKTTDFILHSLATAANDFLVASGVGAFIKKTLAEVKTILGLGSAAYTADTDYVKHSLATAVNNFLVASGAGVFVKKTLAETVTLMGDYFNLFFVSASLNPADSTSYYFSSIGCAPSVTAANHGINIGYELVIIGAQITVSANTTQGTTEDATLKIRNITQATSSSIGTFKTNAVSTAIVQTSFSGLNISVAAGDIICPQIDGPVWATNPIAMRMEIRLMCKRA